MTINCRHFLLIIVFSLIQLIGIAQQNHSMYLQHYLPESNILNPAVPLSCKWYIGIPVLSSTHLNIANSGSSYNQIFNANNAEEYTKNIDNTVKQLHPRNLIGTEFHLQWIALGYRYKEYSFYFTATEKINVPLTYPKPLVQLIWKGNSMFEGEEVGFRGTGVYLNHYREYAITMSKYNRSSIFYGVRAKLLFGKLNLTTCKTDLNLMTDEITFNLDIDGNININSSLPIVIEDINDIVNTTRLADNINPLQLALNRKNPGLAFDAGIIYPYSKNLELSASIIDLGMMRWASNLNNIEGEGNYTYKGELENQNENGLYIESITQSVVDSFNMELSHDNYLAILPPRLLAGAKYTFNKNLDAGLSCEAVFHKTKILPSLTLSGHYSPFENIHLLASYSLQYSSYNHLGFGIIAGKNPVQFYAITDNIPGLIWPLNTRNINLRFGLNIILGCDLKEIKNSLPGALNGNCSCYDDYRRPKRRH